jgi:mannitol/fructose-specific phosphotransferase system IIA component (Ntr-type)
MAGKPGMPLSDIFGGELIRLDLESKNRDEVLEELIEIIAGQRPEYDSQEMLDAVLSRENRMNTAILPGIAVPHGYCRTVSGITGALGLSRSGIDYGGEGPVHSVFMLLMDEASREQHLRVLSRLLELFNSESLAAIRAAESSRQICDILRRF